MALCRSSSVYLPGRPGTEVGAGVRVGAQKTAGVGTGVPLSSVGAPPVLRRVWGPAI